MKTTLAATYITQNRFTLRNPEQDKPNEIPVSHFRSCNLSI